MILGIPHYSQLGMGLSNLCSQACVAMLTGAYTDQDPTPYDVAIATQTADGKPKSVAQLLTMLRFYGIACNNATTGKATLNWHKAQVAAGIPTIALLRYKYLYPGHWFTGAHFLVVVGFDDDGVFIHDPLQTASYVHVSNARFDAAIRDMELNYPYQAVYPLEALPMATLSGVNIEPRGFASPVPDTLKGFGYVRFPIIVKEYAVETIDQAMSLYAPLIQTYQAAGIKVMLPLTHQIGLEGKNFNFENMSAADWQRFSDMYLERVKAIVTRLKGRGVTFQILNEVDSLDNRASVVVPPVHYGAIFNAAYAAIKAIDSTSLVITSGYNSGADRGRQQFIAANIIKTDGVAFHPYGASANGMYQGENIATLQTQISKWQTLNLPLYISEWGTLGFASEPVEKMAQFVSAFTAYCAGRVAAAVYFSWFPQDVHPWNSYPVINADGSIRQPIFDALTGEVITPPEPTGLQVYITGATVINARALPTTSSAKVGEVRTGQAINSILEVRYIAPYTWFKVNGVLSDAVRDYWFAGIGDSWRVDVR